MATVYKHMFSFNCILYNRKYALDTLLPVKLDVTLELESASLNDFNMNAFIEAGQAIIQQFNQSHIINVDNPYLVNILEPKAGNTVHTFIEQTRQELDISNPIKLVGHTIPPETKNGYHMVIVDDAIPVTLEGVARLINEQVLGYIHISGDLSVTVSDGTLAAQYN